MESTNTARSAAAEGSVANTSNEELRYVDYTIVPLFHLMQSLGNAETLEHRKDGREYFQERLKAFKCDVDAIDGFIRSQAWPLEALRVCTTQLFVDEAAYLRGQLDILGFVTLMPSTAVVNRDGFDEIPPSYFVQIKDWLDKFTVAEGVIEMPAYEILQVARNKALEDKRHISIKPEVIVREAERLLNRASDTVGGSFVFADVYDDDMLPVFIDLGYVQVPDDEGEEGDEHASEAGDAQSGAKEANAKEEAPTTFQPKYLLVRSISEPLYQFDAEPVDEQETPDVRK